MVMRMTIATMKLSATIPPRQKSVLTTDVHGPSHFRLGRDFGGTFNNVSFYLFLIHALLINILRIDVTCEEVCVFCFKVFRVASEFMRHAEENHRHETGRKTTEQKATGRKAAGRKPTSRKAIYMQTTYDELGRLVDSKLGLAYTLAGVETESKKRSWDAAGIGPESEVQTLREDSVIANHYSQIINGIDLLQLALALLTSIKAQLHLFPPRSLRAYSHQCRLPRKSQQFRL